MAWQRGRCAGRGVCVLSAAPSPFEAAPSLRDLLAAAKRACEHWGDGPEARQAMKADCLATPPHLRADLIQHFQENYQ